MKRATDPATKAFEAQLEFTANIIKRMVSSHPHYGDDCGDELRNNLDISLYLANSITLDNDLTPAMKDLLDPGHPMYIGNFESYASAELFDYLKTQGYQSEDD